VPSPTTQPSPLAVPFKDLVVALCTVAAFLPAVVIIHHIALGGNWVARKLLGPSATPADGKKRQ